MSEEDLITLTSGPLALRVAPGIGGSIARFWRESGDGPAIEWLRPATAAARAEGQPGALSCFPMVPFSNRIRDGRFRFRRTAVRLPRNFMPQRHAIHGQGWQAPWTVQEASATNLVLEFAHPAGAWPFPYRARQRFTLSHDRLTHALEVTNTGDEAMPLGFGLHPFFVQTPQCRVTAATRGIWLTDDEVMPTEHAVPTAAQDTRTGLMPARVTIDNLFTGWDGQAVIEWPEWRARLTISATAPLRNLVIYSPSDQDFFCIEPVTNITDAFNAADRGEPDTGMIVLEAGETAGGIVTHTTAVAD